MDTLQGILTGRYLAIKTSYDSGNYDSDKILRSVSILVSDVEKKLPLNCKLYWRTLILRERILSHTREYKDSLKKFEEIYTVVSNEFGADSDMACQCIESIALYARRVGKYNYSISVSREQVRILKEFKPESYSLSVARINLAVALFNKGLDAYLDEAEDITRSELEFRTRMWGEESRPVWIAQITLSNIILTRIELGLSDSSKVLPQAEDAMRMSYSVLSGRKKVFGINFAGTVRASRTYARALLALREYDKALWILRDIEIRSRKLNLPYYDVTLVYYVKALWNSPTANAKKEASELADKALSLVENSRNSNHIKYSLAKKNLEGIVHKNI